METVGRTTTSDELNNKYRGKRIRTTIPASEFFDDSPSVNEGVVEGFYDTPGEMMIISEAGEMWAVFPDTNIEVLAEKEKYEPETEE